MPPLLQTTSILTDMLSRTLLRPSSRATLSRAYANFTESKPPQKKPDSSPVQTNSEASTNVQNTATVSPPANATDLSPVIEQAPGVLKTWSPSQQPKNIAMTGARFEQTALEYQPNPLSAMKMIQEVPVIKVESRKAVCDGGGGALGHPKVFINLDQPGPRSCGYCGLRFEQAPHYSHH